MTPESKEALELAVDAAGSQINLCRLIDRKQSSVWTWSKGNGAAPTAVPDLVRVTQGRVTADRFRRDIFGWLAPVSSYLADGMPDDARLAGIDLTWHQIETSNAVAYLMANRKWSRKRARDAVDYLTDNGYLAEGIAA